MIEYISKVREYMPIQCNAASILDMQIVYALYIALVPVVKALWITTAIHTATLQL